VIIHAYMGERVGNKIVVGFYKGSPPVRCEEKISAVKAVFVCFQSIVRLRLDSIPGSGGCATRRVDILDCYVAAGPDAEHRCRDRKEEEEDSKACCDIASQWTGYAPKVSLHSRMVNQTFGVP
jgi:hypothetical protein